MKAPLLREEVDAVYMGLKSFEFVRGALVTELSERWAIQMRVVWTAAVFLPHGEGAAADSSYALDWPVRGHRRRVAGGKGELLLFDTAGGGHDEDVDVAIVSTG